MLLIWNIPKEPLCFAFYLSYAGSATTPVLIAWGNNRNASDPSLGQLLVATSNIVFRSFPTYDASKYEYDYQILILFGGLAIIGICLMAHLYKQGAKTSTPTEDDTKQGLEAQIPQSDSKDAGSDKTA
ncbi:hypothetical protein BGZ60DRAFT_530869 [Tricladium varicosporioides]|nr:hypothetical protein BGZ60DRAFT_530869 [Hymenoscyphus varicosporioides]